MSSCEPRMVLLVSARAIFQIGVGDELRNIDFTGALRFRVGDVGEPFQIGRNIREIPVLIRR